MDSPTKKLIKDLLKLPSDKPYIIKVKAENRNLIKGKEPLPGTSYNMCSCCFAIIEQTWDHASWCPAYEAEKLSEWLKKGKKK